MKLAEPPEDVARTTGGRFDRNGGPLYFVASSPSVIAPCYAGRDPRLGGRALVAADQVAGRADRAAFEAMLGHDALVLLDSGIYALASAHARLHGMSHDAALALASEDIDGFDALYDRYCSLVEQHAERLWGVIELDQGGADNKRRTRQRLRADLPGFVPMPVYHPLLDGWDYFDELASEHDRVCVGNIVQAAPRDRVRLLLMVYERAAAYPYLWVHALGQTPTGWSPSVATPGSYDSSAWLLPTRWLPSDAVRAHLRAWKGLQTDDRFAYKRGVDPDDPRSFDHAIRLDGYRARMTEASWRAMLDEREAAGLLAQPFLRELQAARA